MSSSTTRLGAACTVFACTISGGLLTLPASFNQVYLGPGLILSLFAGITTAISLLSLVYIAYLHPQITSFGSITHVVAGPLAGKVIECTIGIFLIGVLGGSFIVVHDYLIKGITVDHPGAPLIADLGVVIVAILVFFVALPTSMGKFAKVSILSVAAFAFLVITLFYYGIEESTNYIDTTNSTILWWPTAEDTSMSEELIHMASVFPAILFAFGLLYNIIYLFLYITSSWTYPTQTSLIR